MRLFQSASEVLEKMSYRERDLLRELPKIIGHLPVPFRLDVRAEIDYNKHQASVEMLIKGVRVCLRP